MESRPSDNSFAVHGIPIVGSAFRGGPALILAILLISMTAGCGEGRTAPRLPSEVGVDPFVHDTITRTADAVEKAPRNPRAWAQLGELYYAHDYLESALECFDVAVELGPEDPRIRYLRAVIRKRLGDDTGAFEDIEETIRLDDSTPHVRWRAALWYRDGGNFERAERLATDAMQLSGGDRNSRRTLALIELEAGRARQAIRLLRPIVKARPDDRQTRTTLVRALRLSGDLPAAEREAVLAGDVRPDYFDPWLDAAVTRRTDLPFWIRRAQRIANQGDPETARTIQDSVLRKWYPEAREVDFTEGVILVSEGRHDEAAVHFEALVEEHPDWSQAMNRAAAAMLVDSGTDPDPEVDRRARSLLERSTVIEPGNHVARVLLVDILVRSDELDAAQPLMEEIVAAQGWMLEHRLKLARIQFERGDQEESLATLDDAIVIFGPVPPIDLARASILIDLGRLDEAATAIGRARSRPNVPQQQIRRLEDRLREASAP